MEKTGRYVFGEDGRLWTLLGEGQRRPSSVEEMEGYCRERHGAVPYYTFKTYLPQPERTPLPIAV